MSDYIAETAGVEPAAEPAAAFEAEQPDGQAPAEWRPSREEWDQLVAATSQFGELLSAAEEWGAATEAEQRQAQLEQLRWDDPDQYIAQVVDERLAPFEEAAQAHESAQDDQAARAVTAGMIAELGRESGDDYEAGFLHDALFVVLEAERDMLVARGVPREAANAAVTGADNLQRHLRGLTGAARSLRDRQAAAVEQRRLDEFPGGGDERSLLAKYFPSGPAR